MCWRVCMWTTFLPVERLEHHGRLSRRHIARRHRRLHVSISQSSHIRHSQSLPPSSNVTPSKVSVGLGLYLSVYISNKLKIMPSIATSPKALECWFWPLLDYPIMKLRRQLIVFTALRYQHNEATLICINWRFGDDNRTSFMRLVSGCWWKRRWSSPVRLYE